MNRCEFLKAIQKEIGFLSNRQRRQVMSHFNELTALYESEPDITTKLGTPEEALRNHLNESKTTSKIPKPLFISALLILSPFIIQAAIILASLVVALLILMLMLLFLVPVLGVSLWLEGMQIIFTSIPQAVILADKLWQIGIGLMSFAAGSFILLISYKFYSWLIPWIVHRFSNPNENMKKRRSR